MSLLCSCLDMWCPILFSRSTSELLERIYEIKHWHLLNRNFISMKRVSVREIWTDWSSSRAEDVGDCLMSHSHCHTNTQLWFELNWAQFELNWALIWAKLSWINWAKLNPYTISSAVSGLFSVRVGTGIWNQQKLSLCWMFTAAAALHTSGFSFLMILKLLGPIIVLSL